jgi:hypothetical protein
MPWSVEEVDEIRTALLDEFEPWIDAAEADFDRRLRACPWATLDDYVEIMTAVSLIRIELSRLIDRVIAEHRVH